VISPAAQFFAPPETHAAGPAPAALADLPAKIRLQPENVRNGLAQLVLTLVELLRELLERQSLRRIDGGSLAPEEIERLGTTFLQEYFGFGDEDLNLDLGPLGKLR
jgi:hypothetical protein